jgi:hypothetical protein
MNPIRQSIRPISMFKAIPWLAFLLVFVSVRAQTSLATGASTPEHPAAPEIVQRIDAAVYQRFNAISGYTVIEHYSLYRNGASTASAQETVKTVYTRSVGKEYTPIDQSGSSLLRSAVIDKVLAGEKELNLAANREGALITSHNYEMQPDPGNVQVNGRDCILVHLKPRRKSPHLFNGKMWIDASDFTVVRLEGAPSQSPSIFAGEATVARDYVKVDGFSMATHAEARSHTFLFGDTLLKIDYSSYHIDRDPAAPATNP